jgi:hypothetical protein
MRLAAMTPRAGGLPTVQTFECRVCCVALTKADERSSRPAALPADSLAVAGLPA